MRKFIGLVILLFLFAFKVSAQKQIDGVRFLVGRRAAIKILQEKFGNPVQSSDDKIIFENIVFDGEEYSKALCFFDSKGRLNQLRLKTNCTDNEVAQKRMVELSDKYALLYSTTESENIQDGKFVIGYDTNGHHLFTIATYKNICDLSFGPF